MFPLHTWLPDAHTDAPTAGSVILAGVLLKMGTYGFLRLAVPMFPQAAVDLAPLLLVVAVIGIIYGAIVAAMQPNLKRLVAYSSVAHLGFAVLGIFALTSRASRVACSRCSRTVSRPARSFLLVGMLSTAGTRTRSASTAVCGRRSRCSAASSFIAAVRVDRAARLLGGFIGEFLALLGGFLTSRWYVVVATTGVILGRGLHVVGRSSARSGRARR